MDDDWNTPNAIAAIYDFVKQANIIIASGNYNKQNVEEIIGYFKLVDKVFKCFDFLNDKVKTNNKEEQVKQLIEKRNEFRKNKDYKSADEIKQQILALGAEIFDNKDGTTSYKLK